MIRGLLILLTITLSVVGCSSKKNDGVPANILRFTDRQEALKFMTENQVECEGACPEYVGAFYSYNKVLVGTNTFQHNIGMCSVTLVGEKTILTNRHCIEKLFKEGDSCDQQKEGSGEKPYVEIKFPATATQAFQVVKCKKILKTSEVYHYEDPKDHKQHVSTIAPDWALIELQTAPLKRKAVKPSYRSTAEGSLVDLFPVYFTTKEPEDDAPEIEKKLYPRGLIKQVQCARKYMVGHIFMLNFESPLFLFEKCSPNLIPGTSGSGVFSRDDGGIVGVHAKGGDSGISEATGIQCVQGFEIAQRPCTYNRDPIYIEIMSVYTRIELIGPRLVNYTNQKPDHGVDHDNFRWHSTKMSPEAYSKLEMTWNPPWPEYFEYLDGSGNQGLKEKLKFAFAQMAMPRVPECANPSVGADAIVMTNFVQHPNTTIPLWDFAEPQVWTEYFNGYDAFGNERSNYEFADLSVQYGRYPQPYKVTKNNSGVVLESNGEGSGGVFPKPLQKLKIKLPFCQ